MRSFTLLLLSTFLFTAITNGQNIALGKNAYALTIEGTIYNAYQAVDGRGNSNVNLANGNCTGNCTRWSSIHMLDGQYIYIDLAGMYNLSEVRLYWEAASGKNFTIDVSNDGNNWTAVHNVSNNSAFYNSFNMTGQTARYVRMNGISRNLTLYGFSLWEFEVYGTPVVALSSNFGLNAPAFASSIVHPTNVPGNATDGFGGASQVDYAGGCTGTCTYWASQSGDAQYIYVDLGATRSLQEVRLYWVNGEAPRTFTIDVSNDASIWTLAAIVTANYGNANTVNIAGSSGRYVRMQGVTRNESQSIYALYEFEVYGQAAILPVYFSAFNGKLVNNRTELKWTASVDAPTTFEVQKSTDGVRYTAIGTVHSDGLSSREYRFTDESPASGRNHYRIKYTEQGSAPILSKIVTVSLNRSLALDIYPNPVTGHQFQLNMGTPYTGMLDVQIFSNTGKLVHKQTIQNRGEQTIPVSTRSKLAAGIYTVQVITGTTVQKSRLVVAQ